MTEGAYRDPLAGLRARVAQLEAEIQPRIARLRGLRRHAVAPALLEIPRATPADQDDAARLVDHVRRLEAHAHDVEVAIAATDNAIAFLGHPRLTIQDEMLGERPAARASIARLVPDGAIDVLAQATVARFHDRGVGLVLVAAEGNDVMRARLAVAVPPALPPIVAWPTEPLALGTAVWEPRSWRDGLDGSTFWMSYGRAVIAWEGRELRMPEGAVRSLVDLRLAILEAW